MPMPPELRATVRAQRSADQACALPAQTRAAIGREERAIRAAVANAVGPAQADRLLTLADELQIREAPRCRRSSTWLRAQELAQTTAGREQLRTMTWDQV